MDLRALRYFVETARQRSFTTAASHLYVTQSTGARWFASWKMKSGRRC